MIIYSCSVGSVTQAEGGVRSSACPGLWAEKSITAVLFLLPQDRVNAVYLVIRMLFLAFFFFFPLAELVFTAPLLLSCWGSWLWRQAGAWGWEHQHPSPPACRTELCSSEIKNNSPCPAAGGESMAGGNKRQHWAALG